MLDGLRRRLGSLVSRSITNRAERRRSTALAHDVVAAIHGHQKDALISGAHGAAREVSRYLARRTGESAQQAHARLLSSVDPDQYARILVSVAQRRGVARELSVRAIATLACAGDLNGAGIEQAVQAHEDAVTLDDAALVALVLVAQLGDSLSVWSASGPVPGFDELTRRSLVALGGTGLDEDRSKLTEAGKLLVGHLGLDRLKLMDARAARDAVRAVDPTGRAVQRVG